MNDVFCKLRWSRFCQNFAFHLEICFMIVKWAILEKIQTGWVEDILFWKPPWYFSFFYFTPGNSRQNKAQPLDIPQNCVTVRSQFQGQKQRPLEISHAISLIPPANSISSTLLPCLDFFWNSPFILLQNQAFTDVLRNIGVLKDLAIFILK